MYEDTSDTSLCDRMKCEYFDEHCIACDNDACTICLTGYYYSTSLEMCRSCAISYDAQCIACDDTQCTECAWPSYLTDDGSGGLE